MNESLITGYKSETVEPNWKEILEAQKDNIVIMNKTNEKKCANCSRRKFYQVGYRDGFNAGYKYGCEVGSDIKVEDYLRFKKIKMKLKTLSLFMMEYQIHIHLTDSNYLII